MRFANLLIKPRKQISICFLKLAQLEANKFQLLRNYLSTLNHLKTIDISPVMRTPYFKIRFWIIPNLFIFAFFFYFSRIIIDKGIISIYTSEHVYAKKIQILSKFKSIQASDFLCFYWPFLFFKPYLFSIGVTCRPDRAGR